MGERLDSGILECLREKPMSISEIARELDEKKYNVSKRLDVLEEKGYIDTYKIGRSTACILNEDAYSPPEDGEEASEQDPDPEPELEDPDEGSEERVEEGSGEDVAGGAGGKEPPEPEDVGSVPEGAVDGGESGEVSGSPAVSAEAGSAGMASPARRPDAVADASVGVAGGVRRPRTIGVVSGKGGVGKTVVTLNLGVALRDLGRKVIVMDADAEMSNLGLHLGMNTFPVSLSHVVEKDVHIMSAMHVDKDSGLRVIPTSLSAEDVEEDISKAFEKIPEDYIVLLDSPPGFERPIERVIDTCDELIFVTTPEVPAVTDTYKLYKEAKQRGKEVLGVVVNMYSSPKNHLSIKEVEAAVELPVLGVVDHSKVVQRSIFESEPAVSYQPHHKTSRSFKQIAADLTGEEYSPSILDKIRGMIP